MKDFILALNEATLWHLFWYIPLFAIAVLSIPAILDSILGGISRIILSIWGYGKDGRKRKSMFTHAKEAHINLFCDRDVTCNYKRNLGALQDFVANWCSGYMDLDQQLRIGENVFRPQGRSRV